MTTSRSSAAAAPGVREPAQRRSRQTLERFVAAAEALLTEGGPGAVTVQDVVGRADSSVGSFYARFDGRESLVRYLQDRFWERAAARWDAYFDAERAREAPPLEFLAGFVRVLVRVLDVDGGERLRAFLALALSDPDLGLRERVRRLDERIVDGASRLLAESVDPDPPAALRTACREAVRCVLASARDAVLFRRPTSREKRELILSLVRMAATGIGLDDPPRSYRELLELCTAERR